jgi:tyrosinase
MKYNAKKSENMNRRVFIKGIGEVSLGLVFATMFGGCESLRDQIQNRPVRRRLRSGSALVDADIAIYKDAVSQMKALPASNPRSWAAQAGIHGSVSGGFNFCQHGTDHFFSWHRAYLRFFELICQKLTGEKDFGLPYWNWNQNPNMHSQFTSGGSSLNHSRSNTSVAGNAAFSNSTMNSIFSDNNFLTFGSQIEGTPHNTAHVVVGGDMVTGGSPLDPVFWAHHCMVDYCWAKWNIELGNDTTNDPTWLNTSWDHFVNGSGNPVSVTAGITTLMPFLAYQYESSAIGGFSVTTDLSARSIKELELIEKRLRKGTDIRFKIKKRVPIVKGVTLKLSQAFSSDTGDTNDQFKSLIESDEQNERIFVRVKYVQLPPSNDFFVRVFINLPNANSQTATTDIHYAGSFAFFGTHGGAHAGHHPKTGFLVNVTDTLKKLKRQDKLRVGQPLTVQLVAISATEKSLSPDTELNLEHIEFIVSPIIINSKENK